MSCRNPIGNIVGHLRYNLFIVLYPLGVSGELVCFYKTWEYVSAIPEDRLKPYTLTMPNSYNFAFHYELFLKLGIPIIYLVSFPGLFMHVWV